MRELLGQMIAQVIAELALCPEAARKELEQRGMQLALARKLRRMIGEEVKDFSVVGHVLSEASGWAQPGQYLPEACG